MLSSCFPTHRLLAAALFLAASTLSAQVNTGSISGTVADPSGALVSAAKITIVNQDTGVQTAAVTNASGTFKTPFLQPGLYRVRVESPAFKAYEAKDVSVLVSTDTPLTIPLTLGSASDMVMVEASAPLIEADTAQVTFTVEIEKVMNLPRLSSGLDKLALLAPGVSPGFGNINSNGATFSVNGQRARSNNFLLDGQDNNDPTIAGPALFFSNVEAVSEFQVITNQFSAEYGRNSGAIVNITTRSGSNKFNGTANYITRNDAALSALDNIQRASGLTKPPAFIDNNVGGTFGGPVKKDKIFFFAYTYRDFQRSQSFYQATASSLTPTPAGLATLAQYFPNSLSVKSLINFGPFSRTIGSPSVLAGSTSNVSLTGPGGVPVSVEMGRIQRTVATPNDVWNAGTREDFNITQKDRVGVRFFYQASTGVNAGGSGTAGYFYNNPGISRIIAGTYAHIFSPSIVNEFRASYEHAEFDFFGGNTATFANLGTDLANFSLPSGYLGFGLATNIPQYRLVQRYQGEDHLSIQLGRHAMKMGVQLDHDTIPNGFLPYVNGQFTFNTFQDFVNNNPSVFNGAAGNPILNPTETDQGYYFQDDWKVKPNFTLNLGMRYEYDGQPVNILNRATTARETNPSTALFNQSLPLSARTVPTLPADTNNFAPRFGFAYTPKFLPWLFGNDATVFRGGYSVAYDASFYNLLLNVSTGAPNVLLYSLNNFAVPADPTGANLQKLAAPPKGVDPRTLNQTQFAPNLYTPYAQNWSFGFQRRVGSNVGFEVRYVGTRGNGLYQTYNGNPYVAGFTNNGFANFVPAGITAGSNPSCANCDGREFPSEALVRTRGNTAASSYNGLQSHVDGRLFKQVTLSAAYTYSRVMDNASEVFSFTGSGFSALPQNPFNINSGERAPSNYDLAHVANLNFVWEIPAYKDQHGVVGKLLGGWTLAGIQRWTTGRPETIYQSNSGTPTVNDRNFNVFAFSQNDSARPFGGNPGAPLGSTGFVLPGGQLVQYNNHSVPTTVQQVQFIYNNLDADKLFGTPFGIGRNTMRGPTTSLADFSVFKTFKIWERVGIQYRFETTNIFNHVVYNIPNLAVDSGNNSTFLNKTTTEATPRRITMGLRISF